MDGQTGCRDEVIIDERYSVLLQRYEDGPHQPWIATGDSYTALSSINPEESVQVPTNVSSEPGIDYAMAEKKRGSNQRLSGTDLGRDLPKFFIYYCGTACI